MGLTDATAPQAKRTITVALITTGGLVTIRSLLVDHAAPPVRVGVGLSLTGIALALLAEGSPGMAQAFGLILTTAAILSLGGDSFDALSKGLKK